jgi:hypothetical protein
MYVCSMREREREREKERERKRALLETIHNAGSRAVPAHGLRIITLRSASPHTLGGVGGVPDSNTVVGSAR